MTFLIKRVILTIPVLLGVLLLTFGIIKFTPGDPVLLMLGQRATEARVTELREQLRLDDPVLIQFGRYTLKAMKGDLGVSIRSQTPVIDEILLRLPSTVELTVYALVFAIAFGIPAGVFTTVYPNNLWSFGLTFVALIGLSIPNYWLGILGLRLFAVQLGWISVLSGNGVLDILLPALVLGFPSGSIFMRLTRTTMAESLHSDYVRTARAKGLSNRDVIWKHVFRNAMIPIVTAIGLQAAALLGGAVLIESVFARPGLGRYAVIAIQNRDFPQIQGMVLFSAVIYVVLNLFVDLLYFLLDPRLQQN
jgi:ABC-type dipeptide/oligopeptide/nickel transport system permease component